MTKVILTIIMVLLAGFVLLTNEVSNGLRVFLIICLIVTEVLVIAVI